MLTRPIRALWILALATACAGGEAEPARPNVLLISIDTLRADHLSCYGYAQATSPHLDRLASEGVLFEDATSTTSWTLPAHISMLTGLPISAHGVCDDRLWTRPGPGDPIFWKVSNWKRLFNFQTTDIGYFSDNSTWNAF